MWLILLQSTPPGPIPLSGFLLCFVPLALVILGFIAAATVTDRHARRSYLRYTPSDDAPGVKIDGDTLPPNAPLPSDTQMVNR
jgi:hypothetical protein